MKTHFHIEQINRAPLLVKVCGMRSPDNIQKLAELEPDIMGFIFYPESPRYVGESFEIPSLAESVQKAGVFVNESVENVLATAEKYQLDIIQFHGQETPETCQAIRKAGILVIKAISVGDFLPLIEMNPYVDHCDCFLLDTKTESFGGSGRSFNWEILENYLFNKPFLLSGGIDEDDLGEILAMEHPQLIGVDLNSQFEISPGMKDIAKLEKFMSQLKSKIDE